MTKFPLRATLVGGLVLVSSYLAYAQAKHVTKHDKLFDIGVALLQYSDDYDGKLPVVATQKQVKDILGPYVQDASVLAPAAKGNYFAFNFALSGKQHASLNGQNLVAFYEIKPLPNQGHGVLFLPPFDKSVVHYATNSAFVNTFIKEFDEKSWEKESKKQNLHP